MTTMILICRKGTSTATNFTDGKHYPVIAREGQCVVILDDLSRRRVIVPGAKFSPHLPGPYAGHYPPGFTPRGASIPDEPVGHFEIAKES